MNCISLQKFIIPESVTIFGSSTFVKCIMLNKIIFNRESSLAVIENDAFSDCSTLVEIDIPESVKYIQKEAKEHGI